jgi:hypothetical protein
MSWGLRTLSIPTFGIDVILIFLIERLIKNTEFDKDVKNVNVQKTTGVSVFVKNDGKMS